MTSERPQPGELTAFRERYDLTQAELARVVHASERSVRMWENENGEHLMPAASWELAQLKCGAKSLTA